MEVNKDSLVANLSSPPEAPVKLKVTAKPGLCLRKAPSTNATVLEVLGTGTVVEAARDALGEAWAGTVVEAARDALGEAWVPVSTKDGTTGYVKAEFVKEAK